jgi:RNA-dependent RNA polymerase
MDGDLISVIYDTRLFPKQTEAAMQHKPKTPVKLDRDCTIDDVIDFVVSFFRNDMLGQVASRVSPAMLAVGSQADGQVSIF